ncbi:Uu.00g091510.m01.CDS01 [Anthostomella pinea]|uniref:Uu.00g091510.m01.CDS01 n=1 Tax=Anthostomella pinea TaxID=933095 RepID=A0AAI8YKD1_9PEZI|nr:Uu.00g091510.m01.CDS01 [Anthostomella pinea]
MDLAQNLVRSVARAFYDTSSIDTRHIVVVDALVLHSCLRDDDLGYLMSMNLKDLHKICARIRDDRLLQVHVRPELRDGQLRPTNRTYYYIDYRQAIDAIKWRVYHLDKAVQGNAKPASEKKEYFCPRCKAEWTQMEVLDKMDPAHGFRCHRCDSVLIFDADREAGGHEQSTRLNNQLRFVTTILPKLDAVVIPDNTFEKAYEAMRAVVRDATNQVTPSMAVESISKPTAVKGLANTGPQSIAISITDSDGPTEAEKEAERAHKAKIAEANALPTWHVQSTVTGASYEGNTSQVTAVKADEDDTKKPIKQVDDSEHTDEVNSLFSMLAKQQEEARLQAEADSDSDEEEDDEDEEFEDITNNASSVGEKRLASSGTTSAADTPASEERPPKKVKVEEPADEAESEDEDLAFEDV